MKSENFMSKPKIAMIYTCWAGKPDGQYGGVGYYRIVSPARYLSEWYDVTVFGKDLADSNGTKEEIYTKLFTDFDLIWIKAIDSPVDASILCFLSEHFKKPLVLDLDDDYFNVRPDQPGYKWYYPGSQKTAIFSSLLSLVSKVVVSTKPLAYSYAKRLKKIHKKDVEIDILPNFNDLKEFNFKRNFDNGDKVVIGWQGSTTHYSDLEMVLPSLDRLMKKYKNVYLELMGGIEQEAVAELFKNMDESSLDRIQIIGGTKSWSGYPELLSKQKWDIGIAPLIDDVFNRGKSHIKWMEYAAYKIPTVASNVYPYYKDIQGIKTIEDGVTGYLCEPKEWYEKLEKLVMNKELRKKIGNNSYEYIKNNWQPEHHIEKWKKVIDNLLCNIQTQQTKTE